MEQMIYKNGEPVKIGIIGDGIVDIQDITICIINSALYAYNLRYDYNKNRIVEDTRKKITAEEKIEKATISTYANEIKDYIENAELVIADEVHRSASILWKTPLNKTKNAYYRYGFSVHPETHILLRGDIFNNEWQGFISMAFKMLLDAGEESYVENGYEIIDVSHLNIQSRSISKSGTASWNKVNKIIRHAYKGLLKEINVENDHILMTPEHSAFIVNKNNDILAIDAQNIKEKDIMLKDTYKLNEYNNPFYNEKYQALNSQVYSIADYSFAGYVYDLEMNDHPSFFANDILVYNSATPYREDGCELEIEGIFGNVIDYYPIEQAILEEYLMNPEIIFLRYDYNPVSYTHLTLPTIYSV